MLSAERASPLGGRTTPRAGSSLFFHDINASPTPAQDISRTPASRASAAAAASFCRDALSSPPDPAPPPFLTLADQMGRPIESATPLPYVGGSNHMSPSSPPSPMPWMSGSPASASPASAHEVLGFRSSQSGFGSPQSRHSPQQNLGPASPPPPLAGSVLFGSKRQPWPAAFPGEASFRGSWGSPKGLLGLPQQDLSWGSPGSPAPPPINAGQLEQGAASSYWSPVPWRPQQQQREQQQPPFFFQQGFGSPGPRAGSSPQQGQRSLGSPQASDVEGAWVTVFGFPPEDASLVVKEFESLCGPIAQQVPGPGKANWVHVRFKRPLDAQRALSVSSLHLPHPKSNDSPLTNGQRSPYGPTTTLVGGRMSGAALQPGRLTMVGVRMIDPAHKQALVSAGILPKKAAGVEGPSGSGTRLQGGSSVGAAATGGMPTVGEQQQQQKAPPAPAALFSTRPVVGGSSRGTLVGGSATAAAVTPGVQGGAGLITTPSCNTQQPVLQPGVGGMGTPLAWENKSVWGKLLDVVYGL